MLGKGRARPLRSTSPGGYPRRPQIGPLGTPFGTPPETLHIASPPRETIIPYESRLDGWLEIMDPQNPPKQDPKRTHFDPILTHSGPILDPRNQGYHLWSSPINTVLSKGASEGVLDHQGLGTQDPSTFGSTRHRGGIPDLRYGP